MTIPMIAARSLSAGAGTAAVLVGAWQAWLTALALLLALKVAAASGRARKVRR